MIDPPFASADVEAAFNAFPEPERKGLLKLRALIFKTAAQSPEVGTIEETLKWGQPSYLTPETKSGSTIRLGMPKTGGFAIYTHCQTTLISDFQNLFPDDFAYEGNRAIHFDNEGAIPAPKLQMYIRAALTYHLKT
ncbi:DUF1801 domain-containing protein [Lentilitoribacter sp. Alg239-R112]|uniref:DUF1801 domain-containing protein n=1 Tax=Lentilitoribacter sp. Alg239-R112 TaxID=2305987 RepID=UPI0013A6A56F|nr:DUF1801 domain-containing protein [Lentilitoribacter sp. Alg239-R112]